MCEDVVEKIYHIAKKAGINKVAIVTNHLKIVGTLHEEDDKDDSILTLKDVKIWRIDDICNCGETDCNCDDASFYSSEWLHVNVYKIVAFSLQ